MRPATSSFFVNKLVFTSTPASTSGTGYSASTSGSSLARGLYRTKSCRGGSRRHGVNEFSRSRRRFLAVNPSSATPSSTRWRGQTGGPHQLVVTMENLAGPSVERNGGSFQRRLELEHRRSALKPSLPCHPQTPRAPVHAYACLRARQFKAARQLDERANRCK